MSYTQFVEKLKRSNPKLFGAEKILITPASLEVQLRSAYDAGHADGVKLVRDIAQTTTPRSLFESIFGKPD